MKTSCLRLKLVELNFFASFNADDQRKTYVSNVSKYNVCVPQGLKFSGRKVVMHHIHMTDDSDIYTH